MATRCSGVTLIEMMLVMALMVSLYAMAGGALRHLVGQVRLEASALHVWSVLGLARSEALYSDQPVQVCALLMRRNSRLNSCRTANGDSPYPGEADPERDGLLVFADWPSAGNPNNQRLPLVGQYDAREDLRDAQVLAGITLTGHHGLFRLLPDGHYVGKAPQLMLTDRLSGGAQRVGVRPGLQLPGWCQGQHCPGVAGDAH